VLGLLWPPFEHAGHQRPTAEARTAPSGARAIRVSSTPAVNVQPPRALRGRPLRPSRFDLLDAEISEAPSEASDLRHRGRAGPVARNAASPAVGTPKAFRVGEADDLALPASAISRAPPDSAMLWGPSPDAGDRREAISSAPPDSASL
jgi:hypothetical protein